MKKMYYLRFGVFVLTILCLVLGLIIPQSGQAQCPDGPIILNTKNLTAASCPARGSVLISSNCAIGALKYTITDAPTGMTKSTQDDSLFTSLMAGTYTIQAYCSGKPSTTSSITFTIPNAYAPLSVTTTPHSNCGTYTPGGTVDVTVTGGNAPYKYSIIAGTDPNYADASSNYGSPTANTTATLNMSSAGTYQVRVMDNCGQYYTQPVTLTAPTPATFDPFGVVNDNCNISFTTQFNLKNAFGQIIDKGVYLNGGGEFHLMVYDAGAGCNTNTPLTQTPIVINAANQNAVVIPVSASKKYYFVLTDKCGQVTTNCWDGTPSLTPDIKYVVNLLGCGTVQSPFAGTINTGTETFIKYPATVKVKNASSVIVATTTLNNANQVVVASNLPVGNYTITTTDACGNIISTPVIITAPSGTPKAYPIPSLDYYECDFGTPATDVGTAIAILSFTGNIPDYGNPATTVTILSGPSQVGVAGYRNTNGNYEWVNLLPGDYVFRVTTTCGITDIPYTFNPGTHVLQRFITATATSSCGTGNNGIVTATGVFNGAGVLTYSLLNADNGAVVVAYQTGTVFSNLPAGNYQVVMKITYGCGNPAFTASYTSNTVTITNTTTGPAIVKQQSIICEDAQGNALNTGTVFLTLAGASPLKLRYKLSTLPDVDASYTVYSNNSSTNEAITGLDPDKTYDIQVISCGITAATQVIFKRMTPIRETNLYNPCIDQPYTFAVPEMPGAAYEWRNPADVIVSNTYNYSISNYNSSYDGTYNVIVTFGSCVTRTASVTVNSKKCGSILPVKLTSFTADIYNCTPLLTWTIEPQLTDKEFIVEASDNGKNFVSLINITIDANKRTYTYADVYAGSNNRYYRLKLVDKDGSGYYSKTIMVEACKNVATSSAFTIHPNPSNRSIGNITVAYNGPEVTGRYSVINISGQIIYNSSEILLGGKAGKKDTNIPIQQLSAGIYIIVFTTKDGKNICHEKLVVL